MIRVLIAGAAFAAALTGCAQLDAPLALEEGPRMNGSPATAPGNAATAPGVELASVSGDGLVLTLEVEDDPCHTSSLGRVVETADGVTVEVVTTRRDTGEVMCPPMIVSTSIAVPLDAPLHSRVVSLSRKVVG